MKIILPAEIASFSESRVEKEEVSCMHSERCGVLVGHRENDRIVVREVIELENVSENPSFFKIDPVDLYRVWIDAEKRGLEVVGVFHTHPLGFSKPSQYDVRGMKDSGMIWVIIGCDGVRAYIYKNKLEELEVELVGSSILG